MGMVINLLVGYPHSTPAIIGAIIPVLECGAVGGNKNCQWKLAYSEKPWPISTLTTTSST
jgi:hypothetical protein